MKPKSLKRKDEAEFRSDSYEASLTPKERERLYRMLRSKMTIEDVVEKCVRWREGENAGELPCWRTIYNIKCRLNLEQMLLNMTHAATIVENTNDLLKNLVKGTDAEEVLEYCMALIGREVINLSILGQNTEARNAATRLLLKRGDQRRVDRKLDMFEAECKKEEKKPRGRKRTPREKQAVIRQILGTE